MYIYLAIKQRNVGENYIYKYIYSALWTWIQTCHNPTEVATSHDSLLSFGSMPAINISSKDSNNQTNTTLLYTISARTIRYENSYYITILVDTFTTLLIKIVRQKDPIDRNWSSIYGLGDSYAYLIIDIHI